MNLSLTTQKWLLLLVNVILGTILLYSYYHYIKHGGVSIKTLWGKAYKQRNIYIFSMLLATVGYLLVLMYSLVKTVNSRYNNAIISNLMTIQVVIVSISMIWLPLTILYLKENANKLVTMIAVVLTLFIVAMAAFKQISLVKSLIPENNECSKMMKKVAQGGAMYFFIHTFFFDFIGWNLGFF